MKLCQEQWDILRLIKRSHCQDDGWYIINVEPIYDHICRWFSEDQIERKVEAPAFFIRPTKACLPYLVSINKER